MVRDGASRAEIIDFIESVVMKKEPRHYINDPEFRRAFALDEFYRRLKQNSNAPKFK